MSGSLAELVHLALIDPKLYELIARWLEADMSIAAGELTEHALHEELSCIAQLAAECTLPREAAADVLRAIEVGLVARLADDEGGATVQELRPLYAAWVARDVAAWSMAVGARLGDTGA